MSKLLVLIAVVAVLFAVVVAPVVAQSGWFIVRDGDVVANTTEYVMLNCSISVQPGVDTTITVNGVVYRIALDHGYNLTLVSFAMPHDSVAVFNGISTDTNRCQFSNEIMGSSSMKHKTYLPVIR